MRTSPPRETATRTMRHRGAVAALAIGMGIASLFALAGCVSSSAGSVSSEAPAKVEQVAGAKVSRVTLTERAAQRLGIKTTQVKNATVNKRPGLTIPYSAVIYDVDGTTWVYTMPQPLSYVRERVTIHDIVASQALLLDGPRVGTPVVTEGAAMLYGTELGVGK
jgi:hypothetical protein